MAKDNQDLIPEQLFKLGDALAELRYRAEDAWCDLHRGRLEIPKMQSFSLVVGKARSLANVLMLEFRGKGRREKWQKLRDQIAEFEKAFRDAWCGLSREEALKATSRSSDPEFQFDCDLYLLSQSPLVTGPWGDLQSAIKVATMSIGAGLRACIQIGQLLSAEIHPTITGRQRTRLSGTERAYFAVNLNKRLQRDVKNLVGDFDYMTNVDFDLSQKSASGALDRIADLRERIPLLLTSPEKAPGYLGLVLDRRRCRIHRGDKVASLNGPTRWPVLICLARSRGDECSRKELEDAMGSKLKIGNPFMRLDRALSDLRAVLHPLGITIECRRGVGWYLKEISAPANKLS